MKIYNAVERKAVELPLEEVIKNDGSLKIRTDLRDKVEIRQSQGVLRLKVNGIVGRLPISDFAALDIRPKFSISNLNRMVYRSRVDLRNPFSLDRPFLHHKDIDYLPVPLVQSFSKSLDRLSRAGLLREYGRKEVAGAPKPKIDFIKSQQRHWSRLQPTKAVSQQFDYSVNSAANQCLKLAAHKAMGLAKNSQQLSGCVPMLAESIRQLGRVELPTYHAAVSMIGEAQRVPSFRPDYLRAMAEAAEIIQRMDFSLDISAQGVALESYLISLDDVFEKYVRNIISNIDHTDGTELVTVDGNKKGHQRALFSDNRKYKMKPDLIMKAGADTVIIGDAKYKPIADEKDRYQVITHSLGYSVRAALLVYPKTDAGIGGLVRLGVTGGNTNGITVYEHYFDLNGALEAEEEALRNSIRLIYDNR